MPRVTTESARGRGTAKQQAAYSDALETFDSAVCEAIAVSQAQAGRFAAAHVGWGSYLFAQLCSRGTSMIRACPRSRWVHSDSEDWHFSAIAGHARAIMEGYLFFVYMMEAPSSDDELTARINVMNLNDCTRRAEIFAKMVADETEAAEYATQQEELRGRLRSNAFFQQLHPAVQKSCLSGQKPWIKNRDQLIEMAGLPAETFNGLWIHYSQHTHILPMSFYRMEPNGRGSGLENEADREFFQSALLMCKTLLSSATDMMVEVFPDVAVQRCGLLSVFSPGPRANAPQAVDSGSIADGNVTLGTTSLFSAISAALKVGAG